MKTKQRAVIAVAVIVLLAAAVLGAKPAYNLYRDISFYHGERTEAEKTVKAFAEETGHLLRRISPEPDRPLRTQPRDEGFRAELPLPEGHGGRSQRLEGQPDRAAVFAVGPHVGLRTVREGIYRGRPAAARRVLPWLATTLPETKT